MFSTTFTTKVRGTVNPDKQVTFAIATSLTAVAKEAAAADKKAIRGAFTVRTDWDERGPLALKIQPATKQKLVSVMGTAAEFLEKFVKGPANSIVIKLPRGKFIAVPTSNVRRTKRDIIRAAQRPQRLKGKGDVVLPMKSGRGMILYQRVGRRGSLKLKALYVLTPRARIREKDVFVGPARTVFERRYPTLFAEHTAKAIATAR